MKQSVIEIQAVQVLRGGRQVLDLERLRVERGELVAIVGANGAGKSSLLQFINLHLGYHKGQLRLFGQDARSVDPIQLRRRCSLVFQEALLLSRSVFDNVALALQFRGVGKAETAQKVEAALGTFRCGHLAKRQARYLSGGESQRVCLARALVYQPELLLLDEPFAVLDAATRAVLLADLRQVAVAQNMTVLLVSHNFADVLHFAQRAVVLQAGRVLQDDKPEVILRRPADASVAALVGMDNVLPCRVEDIDNKTFLRMGNGFRIPWTGNAAAAPTICCLPGDALYVHGREREAQPMPDVLLTGLIRHIVPGIGTYVMTVEAREMMLTVCVPREQVQEDWLPGREIELGIRLADAHVL